MRDAKFLGIDDTKLHLHPGRVSLFQTTGDCPPIYMEVSPSGACNQRCTFCTQDFLGYVRRDIDADALCAYLEDAADCGVLSVMLGGEGEPFLHPEIDAIIKRMQALGLAVAVTTNGVLAGQHAELIARACTWVKVSIDAGDPSTYKTVHRASPTDWDRMWESVGRIARHARARGRCTVGAQAILLPENAGCLVTLARRAREAGAHYLVIKPFQEHPASANAHRMEDLTTWYARLDPSYREDLEAESRDGFRVIWRAAALARAMSSDTSQRFDRCRALSFWSFIDSGGNAWACSRWMKDERWRIGNIADGFRGVWEGERRRTLMDYVRSMDASACRVNCRAEQMNRYLDRLAHPDGHDAFV